jgi:hypothetical protein
VTPGQQNRINDEAAVLASKVTGGAWPGRNYNVVAAAARLALTLRELDADYRQELLGMVSAMSPSVGSELRMLVNQIRLAQEERAKRNA